jgi:hypothetical protein
VELAARRTIPVMSLVPVVFVLLVCGVIAAVIGERKNLGAGSSFALGALLGLIGIVVVACQKPGLPAAPAGMRAVRCPRCNAVQNVGMTEPSYECWQCHLTSPLSVPQVYMPPPKAERAPLDSVSLRTNERCFKCQHEQSVAAGQLDFVCEGCGQRLRRKIDI